jgi:hypothetical protein
MFCDEGAHDCSRVLEKGKGQCMVPSPQIKKFGCIGALLVAVKRGDRLAKQQRHPSITHQSHAGNTILS